MCVIVKQIVHCFICTYFIIKIIAMCLWFSIVILFTVLQVSVLILVQSITYVNLNCICKYMQISTIKLPGEGIALKKMSVIIMRNIYEQTTLSYSSVGCIACE